VNPSGFFLRAKHLAVKLLQRGLVVEGIHGACAARHEELDDTLHLRWVILHARCNRLPGEQLREREPAESATNAPQKIATIWKSVHVHG
jgi:hypothetical protein